MYFCRTTIAAATRLFTTFIFSPVLFLSALFSHLHRLSIICRHHIFVDTMPMPEFIYWERVRILVSSHQHRHQSFSSFHSTFPSSSAAAMALASSCTFRYSFSFAKWMLRQPQCFQEKSKGFDFFFSVLFFISSSASSIFSVDFSFVRFVAIRHLPSSHHFQPDMLHCAHLRRWTSKVHSSGKRFAI